MEDHKIIFVPDASVLLKWAVHETEDMKQAFLFERDAKAGLALIWAPQHCFYEMCNILGRRGTGIAMSFLSFLLDTDIVEEFPITMSRASQTFKLMKKYSGITFYDACYHALAIEAQGTFLTADEKYYKKTYREGHIMLLRDYGKKR